MYLIVIAWTYVVLMMSVAEATNSNGSILGALITFILYGGLPISLVVYLMGAPARSRELKKREAQARAAYLAEVASSAASSIQPDTGGHAASRSETIAAIAADTGIAPVRKEP